MSDPRPPLIALGLTRYWRAEDGLRLDVGAFVRALEYATGCTAVVLGKPDPVFYGAAVEALGLQPNQVVMVGDDVRSDVEGAAGRPVRRSGAHRKILTVRPLRQRVPRRAARLDRRPAAVVGRALSNPERQARHRHDVRRRRRSGR